MTSREPETVLNPPRWALDPEVRGRLRWWDGARWTEHTADALAATRPPLPSWFARATTCLYAVCALAAVTLVGTFALTLAVPAEDPLIGALANLVMTGVALILFLVGGWAHVLSGSSHVDPTALHRDRVWLLVAWFVPVVHVLYPSQLFGEIWASVRHVRTRHDGQASSLVDRRPWVIGAWAAAWGTASGGVLLLLGFGMQTFIQGALLANALAVLLLAGVVHVIAKEIPTRTQHRRRVKPARSGAVRQRPRSRGMLRRTIPAPARGG